MEITIVPEPCVGEEAKFEGDVVVTLPTYPQRIRYAKQCGLKVGSDGKVDVNGDHLEALAVLADLTKGHIQKVNIKKKDSGEVIDSVELLYVDSDCDPIVTDLALKLTHGFKPTKNLSA